MPKKSVKAEKKEEKTETKEVVSKKHTHEEYEAKVIELAKKGMTSEKIGEHLRREGVHPKEHRKISKILIEKGLYTSPDMKNIQQKLDSLDKHYQNNKQDKKAKKDREKIYGNFRKLKAYLERN
jgi:ribosomal protein S15P/S13E